MLRHAAEVGPERIVLALEDVGAFVVVDLRPVVAGELEEAGKAVRVLGCLLEAEE